MDAPLRMLGTKLNAVVLNSAIQKGLPPSSFVSLALLVGLFLRIAAARGDLWLDEIWSLEHAQQSGSPLAIFTRLRHDNNHFLNTLYLWLLGPGLPAWTYRFAAVICGTLSIPLAGFIARRWGPVESLTAMTLFATSYPLIHYSSEARGYAFLVLFVLAAFELLLRYLDSGALQWVIAFTACSVCGFLAHPVFIQFSLAMGLGTLFVLHRATGSWWITLKETVCCHAGPFVLALLVYTLHWSGMELGGGPPYHTLAKLSETFSLILGGPTSGVGAILVAVQCLLAIGFGLWALMKKRRSTTALVAVAIALPFVQVVALRPSFLFVRYFLVAIVFGIFAVALALGHIYRRGVQGKWAYACLLIGFIAANSWHTAELVRLGRGDYLGALELIAKTTASAQITISSDHDFGVSKLVEFYGPLATQHRSFAYIKGQAWPASGPQWLVLHREAESVAPAVDRLVIEGHAFVLAKIFECAPLSGWRWLCYRRVE